MLLTRDGRSRPPRAALLLAAGALLACSREGAPPPRAAADSVPAAATPATPASTAMPPSAVPTVVHLLTAFDDEGIIERPPPLDSVPGPYGMAGEFYADAAGAAAAIEPGIAVSVDGGFLVLRGARTTIPVTMHGAAGTVPYVPLRALTRALGAYLAVHPEGNFVTMWPGARLCEYRRRFGRPGARVYDGARAEGLFERCDDGGTKR